MAQRSKKETVQIVVAIIGGVAIIIAAFIGILPQIYNKEIKVIETPTISFGQYDDPTGIFSIQFPSGFYVTNRNIQEEGIIVHFGFLDENFGMSLAIHPANSQINILESILDDATKMVGNLHLLSNTKTTKGNFLVIEDTSGRINGQTLIQYYLLESDSNIDAYIALTNFKDEPYFSKSDIDKIIYSFSWSAEKYKEYFKIEK